MSATRYWVSERQLPPYMPEPEEVCKIFEPSRNDNYIELVTAADYAAVEADRDAMQSKRDAVADAVKRIAGERDALAEAQRVLVDVKMILEEMNNGTTCAVNGVNLYEAVKQALAACNAGKERR